MPLPLSFETVPLAQVPRKFLSPEENSHRGVVLVVDDERLVADTRAAILAAWGYNTMTAYDAESALRMASVKPPEILISDVILTGMNGVDLAIAIKTTAPSCRVILFSGQIDGLGLLTTAQNAGHNFTLLSKPVHPMDLFAQLEEWNCANSNPPRGSSIRTK
jgi:DNA-binding NtrC family response regulator